MSNNLIKDLRELVDANVISNDTANDITAFYQRKRSATPNTLTITLAILGALLVGSGIVLLVAHNWDELSKVARTVLAFLPLVLSQLLGLYTLIKKKQDVAWGESAAVFLFLCTGASIALISQIYQIGGSLSEFLLTWTAVGIPLVYIFSSSTLAVLCVSTLTWYACMTGYDGTSSIFPMLYLVGMICLLPYYWMLLQTKPTSNAVALLNWMFAISVVIVLGTFTHVSIYGKDWLALMYSTLFCLYIAVGRTNYFHTKHILRNSFLLIGIPGLLIILLIWTFRTGDWLYTLASESSIFSDPLPYITILLGLILTYVLYKVYRQDKTRISPDIFAFAIFFLCIGFFLRNERAGQVVMNILILLIACYYIYKGAKFDNLPILNFGLIVFAVLAICRFFDDEIPFLFRGLLFVVAGVGFFTANLIVIRKRKKLNS